MNPDWYRTPQYKEILDEIENNLGMLRTLMEEGIEDLGGYHLAVGRLQALKAIKDYLIQKREES